VLFYFSPEQAMLMGAAWVDRRRTARACRRMAGRSCMHFVTEVGWRYVWRSVQRVADGVIV
jgi:hypothetical protein